MASEKKSQISDQSDEEIIEIARKNEPQIFSWVVVRYEEKMKRYARKFLSDYEDIQDITQKIFLKAFANINSFDTKRKFSSWLYRIAHNELVNALKDKKKKTLPLFDFDIFFPHQQAEETLEEKIDKKSFLEEINGCLEKLDLKYKEPIILYYLEDFSYKEISDILRIPVSTVGIRLQRGKKIAKSICQKNEKNYGTTKQ